MSGEDKLSEVEPKLKRDPFALEILTQVQLAEDRHVTLRTFAPQEIPEADLNNLLDKIFKAADRSQAFYHKKLLEKHLELHEKRLEEMMKQESNMLELRKKAEDGSTRRKEYVPTKQELAQEQTFKANVEHLTGEITATKKSIAECDEKISGKPKVEKSG